MASRIVARGLIAQLTETWEPRVRDAFLAAVDDLRNNADVQRIAEALERNDIDGAMRAVHLDGAALALFESTLQQAYEAGGLATTNAMPPMRDRNGMRAVIRFDGRIPRAEAWLRTTSSNRVTAIIEDQRRSIRSALVSGMEAGRNPLQTALDVAGRYNRTTGRREGGIIGLTSQQAQYVRNARDELLSGDPALMRGYFERERRDRRFDRSVARAIREGRPVDVEMVEKISARYSDRLLQYRGEMVARTETMASLQAAKQESFAQAVDTGAVARQDIRRRWRHSFAGNNRHDHVEMNGQIVGLDEPFIAPDGTPIMYPGDPNAGARHVVACRCDVEYTIDFLGRAVRDLAAA